MSAPLTDDELARIQMNVWLDGRLDDDRLVLLDEVKRLRAERAGPPGYFVRSREGPTLWAGSQERVFTTREDAEWHRAELERTCPDLVGRLGIFEAYLVVGRER